MSEKTRTIAKLMDAAVTLASATRELARVSKELGYDETHDCLDHPESGPQVTLLQDAFADSVVTDPYAGETRKLNDTEIEQRIGDCPECVRVFGLIRERRALRQARGVARTRLALIGGAELDRRFVAAERALKEPIPPEQRERIGSALARA